MRKARSSGAPWSAFGDFVIRATYPDHGAAGVAAILPGRSLSAIMTRAKKLGVVSNLYLARNLVAWTDAEVELLTANAHMRGADLARLFPTRTKKGVIQKRFELGLSCPQAQVLRDRTVIPFEVNYSAAECAILREHFERDGVDACMALLPKRSRKSITNRAERMGLSIRRWRAQQKRAA